MQRTWQVFTVKATLGAVLHITSLVRLLAHKPPPFFGRRTPCLPLDDFFARSERAAGSRRNRTMTARARMHCIHFISIFPVFFFLFLIFVLTPAPALLVPSLSRSASICLPRDSPSSYGPGEHPVPRENKRLKENFNIQTKLQKNSNEKTFRGSVALCSGLLNDVLLDI